MKPSQMPELRQELTDWLRTDYAAGLWHNAVRRGIYDWFLKRGDDPNEAQAVLRGVEITKLEGAELFYVSAPMVELAVAAGRTLPPFDLARQDLPSRSGLMVFDKCVGDFEAFDTRVGVRAIAWAPDPVMGHRRIFGSVYADRDALAPYIAERTAHRDVTTEPHLMYLHGREVLWEFGANWDQREYEHLIELTQTVRSTWLLMQQTLAAITDHAPDRGTRRRLEKAQRPVPRVRVIELRRHEHSASRATSDREYHHQWIVRGHWRQQPCGPGRVERRPTWITPHVKGPDGAPMLGGEKVYAWNR